MNPLILSVETDGSIPPTAGPSMQSRKIANSGAAANVPRGRPLLNQELDFVTSNTRMRKFANFRRGVNKFYQAAQRKRATRHAETSMLSSPDYWRMEVSHEATRSSLRDGDWTHPDAE